MMRSRSRAIRDAARSGRIFSRSAVSAARRSRNRIEEANRSIAEYTEVDNAEFSKFANQRLAKAVEKAAAKR